MQKNSPTTSDAGRSGALLMWSRMTPEQRAKRCAKMRSAKKKKRKEKEKACAASMGL